jgi:hypothetical protein
METINRKAQRKKSKKPIFILVSVFVLFGGFVYLLMRPSIQSKALAELEIAVNKSEVKDVWNRYKPELAKDEEFLFQIRTKLSSFELTDNDIKECIDWLPPAPKSTNLIIVPDLSKRITDTLNNPSQIQNDIMALNAIWNCFKENSKLKMNSKDKLIVDVTDIDQAKGQFGKVANELQFDLSKHQGKSNRLFFNDAKDEQFKKAIVEMYALGKQKTLGADYRFYLRRYLGNHLQKPTLFDDIENKLIIITDGYLEAQDRSADTKIYGYEKLLHQAVDLGNVLDVITKNGLNVPVVDIDLSNTDILVCEVNERKSGKGFDFEVLKTYWEDWFKRMKKDVEFIQREQASTVTIEKINKFIKK